MGRILIGNETVSTTPSSGKTSVYINTSTKRLSTIDDSGTVRTFGEGDVTGPGSSTDNSLVRFDGTTGKLLQASGIVVDDSGNMTVSGNLTVDGTVTTINSTTLTVDDKNIELGSVSSPSNATADGGGITLKGATDFFNEGEIV